MLWTIEFKPFQELIISEKSLVQWCSILGKIKVKIPRYWRCECIWALSMGTTIPFIVITIHFWWQWEIMVMIFSRLLFIITFVWINFNVRSAVFIPLRVFFLYFIMIRFVNVRRSSVSIRWIMSVLLVFVSLVLMAISISLTSIILWIVHIRPQLQKESTNNRKTKIKLVTGYAQHCLKAKLITVTDHSVFIALEANISKNTCHNVNIQTVSWYLYVYGKAKLF